MQTWLHIIDWRATSDPETLAVSDEREQLTYRQFHDRIEHVAAGWHAAGIGSDDVVAVISRNSVEHLVQTLGLIRLGALPLLINWRMTEHEVSRLFQVAKPAGVFADETSSPIAGGHGTRLQVLDGAPREGWINLEDGTGIVVPCLVDRLRTGQTAFLMHTSGTTGLPKVIPLDHGSLIRSLAGFAIDIGDQVRGSKHLVMMPLFHLAGFAQAMQCFLTGGSLYIQDGFDAYQAIDKISREGINFFTAAPTIIEMLADAKEGPRADADLSSLLEVQYGAAPIEPELLERAVRVICPRFRQIYGSTELQGFLTTLRPEDHVIGTERLRSAGQVVQGWAARTVDATGTPLPAGSAGELQVRGENVIAGYWMDPEQTAAAFTEDGWYRTGDMAVLSANGFVTIVGRTKDMIVSGGENVYPAEIERVLLEHPVVVDVAVVARPDSKWGETPVAFVVLAPESALSTADLERHCRERLAGFKCPSDIKILEELPRNTLGKVRKVELRDSLTAEPV